MKTHYLLIIALLGCLFLTYSCEDSNEDSDHFSEKLDIIANLGNNDGTKPFYIYGARDIDFSISADKGRVDLVQFFYQETELNSFSTPSGRFHFTPDMSKAPTNLEMRITISVDQKKYYETVTYNVKYAELSEADFELKDATIDCFVFKMVGERYENYKYMLGGAVIEDLDNITIKRKFAQNSFPSESSIRIQVVPKEQEYWKEYSYPYTDLNFGDEILGNFHIGSTKSHYIDGTHKELYMWTGSELAIFDKDMKEVKNKPIEDTNFLSIAPKSGLAVIKSLFGNVLTYSDNNFSKLISSINLGFNPVNLRVGDKDQLFNGHNFQMDVYDLYTGKSIYTLQFDNFLGDYSIIGDKLLVRLGNNGDSGNQVYQLNEKSSTFLYSFEKTSGNCIPHPTNKNHIIFSNTYDGFEVFDLESQKTLFSFKGQFQSIDPIKGTLLYYDENYSYPNGMYENHVLDQNYNKIMTFEDASQSTYGAFIQFNNRIIKSDRYTNLLPREMVIE